MRTSLYPRLITCISQGNFPRGKSTFYHSLFQRKAYMINPDVLENLTIDGVSSVHKGLRGPRGEEER